MDTLSEASELNAVNELLAAVSEGPIESTDSMPPSGVTALFIIRQTSRQIQEEPRWFNSSEAIQLTPNTDGEIVLSPDILDIDGTDLDVIAIGGKLFNQEAQSYLFTAPVECDLVLFREWSELPPVARRYITALALQQFLETFPGADSTSRSRERSLQRAHLAFKRADLRNRDLNLLNNSSIQTSVRRR